MHNRYLIFSILILAYIVYYVTSLDAWHLIDNADLIIHEAGHMIFIPFGSFMTILGGSLLQVLVPLIFAGYFMVHQQYFAISVMLYWAAINFINVSVYAGDALLMQLPLLTGDEADHDWNQLLFQLGWLRHTATVSHVIFAIGIVCILIALAYAWHAIWYTEEISNNSARV